MNALPNRIREMRKHRGWTLEKLADKLDCGITMVSDLERGERELTYHWMQRLARAFGKGVKPADLLLIEDNSSALNAEQQELVGLFDKCDPAQQQQLLHMLRIFSGSQRKVA